MFVKPAPGRSVRWPRTMRPLSAKGETVPNDFFWRRLLSNGDVIEQETAEETKKAAVVSNSAKKEDKN